MNQVPLKIVDGIYNIKKEEVRLKEISEVSIAFKEGLLKVVKKVQRQLNWI